MVHGVNSPSAVVPPKNSRLVWATGQTGAVATDVASQPATLLLAASLGVVLLFVVLAFDGRLHWDEAACLYTGGFVDWETILKGEFLGGIYTSRLLHILPIVTATCPLWNG